MNQNQNEPAPEGKPTDGTPLTPPDTAPIANAPLTNSDGANPSEAELTPSAAPVPAEPVAETPRRPLPKKLLWLFRFIAVVFPLAILLIAEIIFRFIPSLNEEKDPYVNISPVSVFSRKTVNGQEYYNITHKAVLGAENVSILVKKPADTIRVFCVGSSACAGWPHPRSETFSAYLQQALQTAYPDKHIEVVNAAAHGFAAYRTRRVLDEVIQMEPDAVLVWEGNNEFLEDRNYAPAGSALIGALSKHLRTVQWLRSRITDKTRIKIDGADPKGVAQFFWAKTREQSLRLREDPAQFAQVQEHFRASFEHMARQSERYKVPIILCTVPVNLRDWFPTVSHNGLRGEALQQWQKLYNQARRSLIQGRPAEGIQAMRQAIAMENTHADSYFWLGRLLEADKQPAAAAEAYSKARDQDYNPFRALSSFNDAIRQLAKNEKGNQVYLLDLDRLFFSAAASAAPGFDLFLDYVHPNKRANLLVAENVYNLMTREGVLKGKPRVDRFTYRDLLTGPNGQPYRDETDQRVQVKLLNLAAENRQMETVVKRTEKIVETITGRPLKGADDPELEQLPPEAADRYRAFWYSLDVQRRIILGEPVAEAEQQEAVRKVKAYYDRWYPYGRF